MKQLRNSCLSPKVAGLALATLGLSGFLAMGSAGEAQAATKAIIDGVIDRITVDNMADHWSGGVIEVGEQKVIIPKNLLMDLPANRMTLQEFMLQAPGVCPVLGQSGLARADSPACNTSGQPGYALIQANRTSAGNIIAGDVFIQKGVEAVEGTVTYIDYNNGFFRMSGNPGDPTTGVMVRINDPDSRHTVQPNTGPGCLAGQSNCSADPRFTLDPDNYTNVFTTGYPLCIPSRTSRTFNNVLGLGADGLSGGANPPATLTAVAALDGTGDMLCPTTNRTIALGQPVDDSRRFAPIMLGDSVTAEGNFEKIGGVRFLSAHATMVEHALMTKDLPDQPDYLFLDEVFIDAPGFQNERTRSLIIGFATLAPFHPINLAGGADVLFWTIHYDPTTNSPHELPWSSVVGCDIAAGPSTCGAQGLAGVVPGNVAGANIFRIRHDVDFGVGAKARFNPCAHLLAEPRFGVAGLCPGSANVDPKGFSLNISDMFGVLSPIPHEIQTRTGHKMADLYVGGVQGGLPGPNIQKTLDINGNEATNGQYLFPFGIGLGGIDITNFLEVDIDRVQTPFSFSGIPWNLDRRLSPGGCFPAGVCENNPQPLTPFPFEGTDPRLAAVLLPSGPYTAPAFTNSVLTSAKNRILSYVDGTGKANGNTTVLAWPPANSAAIAITPVVDIPTANLPPTITSTPNLVGQAAPAPTLYQYQVVATDDGGAANLTYSLSSSAPAGMSIVASGVGAGHISWNPAPAQAPAQGVTVTVTDSGGLYDKQAFVIGVNGSPSFVNAVTAPTAAKVGVQYSFSPAATDPNTGDTQAWVLAVAPTGTAPLGPTTINPSTGRFTWTPSAGQVGPRSFALRVTDAAGATVVRNFNVTVTP
ncbi:MAG: Ig domain-containing protein [Nitrospira sp.]